MHGASQATGTAKAKKGLGPFAVMSIAYILFTTTDGGVRVIVLLHAYQQVRLPPYSEQQLSSALNKCHDSNMRCFLQGFSALALASIFSGYELAGVIVNRIRF